jgi:hypothetical protein
MKSSYSSPSARGRQAHKSTNADAQRKREEAAVRQAEYSALSIEQKIARAKSRRGASKRELTKLYAQLAAMQPKVA